MEFWDTVEVIVPFRLASRRFPNKALAPYRGKPLIEHALFNASRLVKRPIVVTAPAEDLKTAAKCVDFESYDVRLMPSALSCRSATERAQQLVAEIQTEHLLTLPIDEPEVKSEEIKRVLAGTESFGRADALTFYCDFFAPEDYLSPLSAKMVIDSEGMLLYMSRAVIPVKKDGTTESSELKKNVGVTIFKRNFLLALNEKSSCVTILDQHEGLEQLRWLELGFRVKVHKIDHIGFGIDVEKQLELSEQRCAT